MHIVLVHVHVKEETLEQFVKITLENARNSILEPGILRFDVYQQKDDPNRFTLVEIYYKEEDQLKHRETSHYKVWRDAAADMMAEPRQGLRYTNLYPRDDAWSM